MSKEKLSNRLLRRALRLTVAAVGRVPLGRLRALARLFGRAWYVLDGMHRNIARSNLALAFGGARPPEWIEAKARLCFQHIAQVFVELVWAMSRTDEELHRMVEFVGLENYQKAISKGKGVIFITPHLGNWELASPSFAMKHNAPMHVVVRRLDKGVLDELVTRFRERGGNVVVPKRRAMRPLMAALKRNGRVGVLLDQNVDWYDGVWVPFFGVPACTNKGVTLLALKTGVPVLPSGNFRLPDGRFLVFFLPEVPPVITGDRTVDLEKTTERYNRVLEKVISIRPEQWFWVHRRWKTRPYRFWPRELNR